MTASRKPVGVTQNHVKDCPRTGSCRCTWGYYARVSTPAGSMQFKRGSFPTQAAAKAARAAIIEQHRTGLLDGDMRITVGEWLTQWLAYRTDPLSEEPLRPTTAKSYQGIVTDVWIPRLGALKLSALRAEHIEKVMRDIKRDNPRLSANSRRLIYAVLRSAMRKGVQRKLIARSPCDAVDSAVLPSVPRRPVQPWQPQQLQAFLNHPVVKAHRLAPLFHLAIYGGLRRGELAGVAWDDVDLDNARLTVRQQAVVVGYQVVVGDPKSEAGKRVIDLADETVKVLREVRVRTAAERLAWGEAWTDTGRVFCWEDGRALHPEVISKSFVRLARIAGMPPARFHDLRHANISMQIAANVPLSIVSKRAGHSQLSVTSDTYGHLLADAGKQAAAATAALMSQASGEE